MVQKIAGKIVREGKYEQILGVLDFLTRNTAHVAKKYKKIFLPMRCEQEG